MRSLATKDFWVYWVKLFPFLKLKSGYVDLKMSPEPLLTKGVE